MSNTPQFKNNIVAAIADLRKSKLYTSDVDNIKSYINEASKAVTDSFDKLLDIRATQTMTATVEQWSDISKILLGKAQASGDEQAEQAIHTITENINNVHAYNRLQRAVGVLREDFGSQIAKNTDFRIGSVNAFMRQWLAADAEDKPQKALAVAIELLGIQNVCCTHIEGAEANNTLLDQYKTIEQIVRDAGVFESLTQLIANTEALTVNLENLKTHLHVENPIKTAFPDEVLSQLKDITNKPTEALCAG